MYIYNSMWSTDKVVSVVVVVLASNKRALSRT